MNQKAILALLFGLYEVKTAGYGVKYDYITNGADWPETWPECGMTNQSPIDLKLNSSPLFSSVVDNFQKIYSNQVGEIEVGWTGDTTKVPINKEGQDLQTFSSRYSRDWMGGSETYTGVQFHFHAGSEHTIEGDRHDLEMHTVHLADDTDAAKESGIGYAAVGIMFSVDKYNAKVSKADKVIIDRFFDSMKWDELSPNPDVGSSLKYLNPIVDEVSYGELMMMVNTSKRWVYKGSVTTPPCAQSVYWNVLQSVYPIKQAHYDQYLRQLKRGANDLDETGNFRVIQPVDHHNTHLMITPEATSTLISDTVRQYAAISKYTKKLLKVGTSKSFLPFVTTQIEYTDLYTLPRIQKMIKDQDEAAATMGLVAPNKVELAAFQTIIDILKSKFTTTQQVRDAIDTTIDADMDGIIQFSEFNELVKDSGLTELQIKQMYNMLDADNNSFLTCQEMKDFVGTL